MGREVGIRDAQLLELARYRESAEFTPLERLALDLAVAMTRTPAEVPPELVAELRVHMSEAELVELAASIAWEQYRARFNRVFGVRSAGYSEGAFCVLPERPAS